MNTVTFIFCIVAFIVIANLVRKTPAAIKHFITTDSRFKRHMMYQIEVRWIKFCAAIKRPYRQMRQHIVEMRYQKANPVSSQPVTQIEFSYRDTVDEHPLEILNQNYFWVEAPERSRWN